MTKNKQHLLGIALLSLTLFNAIGIVAMLSQYSHTYSFTYPIRAEATPPTLDTPPQPVATSHPVTSTIALPSQEQKDTVQRTCVSVFDNRKDMIQANNISEGLFLSTCYYDLLAMTYAESRFDCSVVGDNGKSRGCLQIQTSLHGITVAQAEDYSFATAWTLDRMVRNYEYPYYRTLAILSHNGIVDGNPYAIHVMATSDKFRLMKL